MKLPLQYITGEFYLILNAPEKPDYKDFLIHENYRLAVKDYDKALASAERLKVMNPKVIEEQGIVFKKHAVEGRTYDWEGSYEVEEKCDVCNFMAARCISNKNPNDCCIKFKVAVLLPQEEQKPIKSLYAGDYPENMMTTAINAMNEGPDIIDNIHCDTKVEEQKSELKPTDAGFKWFTCPTCDGKGSVPQDKSVEVIQQENTAIEFAPSEDLIVAFAKWYSGMDETKVRAAYKRYLVESKQQKG